MMNRLIFLVFFALLVGYPAQRPAQVASSHNSYTARSVCAGNSFVNGDFEQGSAGWLVQPNPKGDNNLIGKYQAYDGLYSAKLGGEVGQGSDYSRDTIQQLVTIPNRAVLTFQWLMETTEPYPQSSLDTLWVVIMDIDEYPYEIMDVYTVFGAQDTWQLATVDLSKYSGQRKNVRFSVSNDEQHYSTFYIDAVCLYEARDQFSYLPLVTR